MKEYHSIVVIFHERIHLLSASQSVIGRIENNTDNDNEHVDDDP